MGTDKTELPDMPPSWTMQILAGGETSIRILLELRESWDKLAGVLGGQLKESQRWAWLLSTFQSHRAGSLLTLLAGRFQAVRQGSGK